MGPHLLRSYQAIYIEICKHGRLASIPDSAGRWAHDRSPTACRDFLAQFSPADQRLIAGDNDLKPRVPSADKCARNWFSTTLDKMSAHDREELLAELQGV